LHLHSTNSDGLASPEEVIELAGSAGLWAMCLSDHSRPTYDPRLAELASRRGVLLLPGLEISTLHNGCKYHVLAYGDGVLDTGFLEFAFRPTAIKNATYRRVLADLHSEGVSLPDPGEILAVVQAHGAPRHPGKWMFSSTLIGRYLAPALAIAEDSATQLVKARYNALKGRESDRYVSTEETIVGAREVGSIPVIAHPFWECSSGRNSWEGVVRDLRRFAELGLAGVEVSSRHDAPEDEQRRADVARDLSLVPFRGSDFHANGKTRVGQFPMPAADLRKAAARCTVAIPPPGEQSRADARDRTQALAGNAPAALQLKGH
jgi:hypothetical protein